MAKIIFIFLLLFILFGMVENDLMSDLSDWAKEKQDGIFERFQQQSAKENIFDIIIIIMAFFIIVMAIINACCCCLLCKIIFDALSKYKKKASRATSGGTNRASNLDGVKGETNV